MSILIFGQCLITMFCECSGQLKDLLRSVRNLADFEETSSFARSFNGLKQEESSQSSSSESSDVAVPADSPVKTASVSTGDQSESRESVASEPGTASSASFRYGGFTIGSPSELLMVNFRELLWYWQEYYLRRGRDRLSLEFSSHVPFHKWIELVGM
jgi:hypothetical protein